MCDNHYKPIGGKNFVQARKREDISLARTSRFAELSEENYNLRKNFLYVISVKTQLNYVVEPEKSIVANNVENFIAAAFAAGRRKDTTDCSRKTLRPPYFLAIALYGRRALFRRCHYDRILQLREQERIKKEREDYAKRKMQEALRILQGYK